MDYYSRTVKAQRLIRQLMKNEVPIQEIRRQVMNIWGFKHQWTNKYLKLEYGETIDLEEELI